MNVWKVTGRRTTRSSEFTAVVNSVTAPRAKELVTKRAGEDVDRLIAKQIGHGVIMLEEGLVCFEEKSAGS